MTEIDGLLTQVAEASRRYLHSLGDRSVRAELNVAEVREAIDSYLADDGDEATDVLGDLIRLG